MDTTTNTDGRRFDLPNSGVFMPDLSKHPILRQIHELIGAIEVCGASPELTRAVCMAAALYEPAEALVDSNVAFLDVTQEPPLDSDIAIERQIRASGADVAPRVTKEHIDSLVADLVIKTHHFPGTTSTVATASLPDGYVVATGHSACISPENFKAHIGVGIASDNAIAAARTKLWELEGYLLRASLHNPRTVYAGGIMASDAEFVGGSMAITQGWAGSRAKSRACRPTD